MTRVILAVTLLMLAVFLAMSGCSELRIIGKAAIRELSSEAINVERASYQMAENKIEEKKAEVRTTVAQATPAPTPITARKKKAEQKKGLWEHQ